MPFTIDTDHIKANWKSTVVGVLGLVIAETIAWEALPPKATVAVTIAALCRAAIMFITVDAGTTTALVNGSKQSVDSHETPDDPNAKVVKQ